MKSTENFEQWVANRMRQFAEPSAADIAVSRNHVRENIHAGRRTPLDGVRIEVPYSTSDGPSRRASLFVVVTLLVTTLGSATLLWKGWFPRREVFPVGIRIPVGESRPEPQVSPLQQPVIVPNLTGPAALRFELAAIRAEETPLNYLRYQAAGDRFTSEGTSLAALIRYAYDVAAFQVIRGPEWAQNRDVQFRIQARAEAAASDQQMRQMLQTLLAERFKLSLIHHTTRTAGYLLLVDSNGPKFLKSESVAPEGCLPFPARCNRTTMSGFADYLSKVVFRMPVVDQTSLAEMFDLTLEWRPDSSQFGGNGGVGFFAGSPDGPSIFTAIKEQLGLRLEPATVPVEILEIDHVETPSDN